MGISRAGELRRLCEVAIPRVGLITNIGPTHLETLGNLDGVASAKAELIAALSPSEGVAILNRDDPFYATLRSRAPGRVVTFGLGPDADVSAEGIQETDTLTRMDLSWDPSVLGIGRPAARTGRGSRRSGKEGPGSVGSDRTRITIHLPIIGRHNALNAAAACAAGLVLGCEPEEIKRGLEAFRPVAMRSEVIGWEGRTILYDVYNANPASVQAALEMLSRFSGPGRRIAVLGDMLELGAAATDAHRQIGRAVASSGIHALITLGSLGAVIAEEAQAQGLDRNRVRVCQDPSQAGQTLKEMTESGDVILLKGSRGMRMERILDHLSIKR
jgi:UDP-N-acetylmuramyl pentapeptide synthase